VFRLNATVNWVIIYIKRSVRLLLHLSSIYGHYTQRMVMLIVLSDIFTDQWLSGWYVSILVKQAHVCSEIKLQ